MNYVENLTPKPVDRPFNLNTTPLVAWALSKHPDDRHPKAIRAFLVAFGLHAVHWKVLERLCLECNAWVVEEIANEEKKEAILATLLVLSTIRPVNPVDKDTLEGLVNLVALLAPDKRRDPAFVRIVKKWLRTPFAVIDELEDVVNWWLATKGGAVDLTGGWPRLLNRSVQDCSWEMDREVPSEIQGMSVKPLLTTEELAAEGVLMAHCLDGSRREFTRQATQGKFLAFHVSDPINPILCATLSLTRTGLSDWEVDQFATVGGGEAPFRLKRVIAPILGLLNPSAQPAEEVTAWVYPQTPAESFD